MGAGLATTGLCFAATAGSAGLPALPAVAAKQEARMSFRPPPGYSDPDFHPPSAEPLAPPTYWNILTPPPTLTPTAAP